MTYTTLMALLWTIHTYVIQILGGPRPLLVGGMLLSPPLPSWFVTDVYRTYTISNEIIWPRGLRTHN